MKQVAMLPVDSGQLAVLGAGLVKRTEIWPVTEVFMTSDFKSMLVPGRDFKHWEEPVEALGGLTPNAARAAGKMLVAKLHYADLLPYNYEGCSAASLSPVGHGVIGDLDEGEKLGMSFGVNGDGEYPVYQLPDRRQPALIIARAEMTFGEVSRVLEDPGKVETHVIHLKGETLLLGDPCYETQEPFMRVPVTPGQTALVRVYSSLVWIDPRWS